MKTSNTDLLAEIDTLEDIKRVNANDLEFVKRIDQLESALAKLINKAEECDCFPSIYIDNARNTLDT